MTITVAESVPINCAKSLADTNFCLRRSTLDLC